MTINITTLPNGLRIVTDTIKSVESVAVGIWLGVGTRHEDMRFNGAAHMVEHMMFKGTHKRNAYEIAEVIENVGGNMNAYTSREVTSYHIHLLRQDLPLAVEVLADIIQNSTMPEDEIERERNVILQEIGMCHDTPDDVIFDNYYEAAYANQAIGAPILGTVDTIRTMTRTALVDYTRQFYTPSRMVICAAGNVEHDAFVQQVTQHFTNLPQDQNKAHPPAHYTGGEHRAEKDLEQSHIVLGFRSVSRLDADNHAAQVLSSLLGGGMSSRLFQEVREKRGLVYSIFSFHSANQDDGQFGIYAGTGADKLTELIPVICAQIHDLQKTLQHGEIERAKAQLKASLLMGLESMMSRAEQASKSLLLRGYIRSPEEIIAQIDAVDKEALIRVSQKIFTSTPTLAALGPIASLEPLDAIRARLAA